jgi:cell shape-determining protein MreD
VSRPVGGRVWALVAVLIVLHLLLHVALALGVVAPDLMTVALLIAAREVGMGRAAAIGFGLGLLEDGLSVIAFGANTVAMTLIGIGGALTRDLFVGDTRLFIVLYFWLGKWIRDLLHWVSVGEDLRQPLVDVVIVQGAIGGAYAAAVGIALVAILGLTGEP